MAETRGTDGVIKVKAVKDAAGTAITGQTMTALLHVTNFTLEETTETIDVTTMGDGVRAILATFQGFSGTVDGYWDAADTGLGHQADNDPVVKAGSTIEFELYPAGEAGASNVAYYNGSAIVTSVSRTASFDGAVEYSLAFDGTGALSFSHEGDS
tara:strand:+ start:4396 stop:4860 length:465 start_codon:yes stop_codon:yes gene_type:complete